MHASQGYAYVFPPERLGYGFAEAGLADTRRAVETEDRRLHVAFQLEDRKVFDDPVLDSIQTVMVCIQDFLGVFQVKIVLGHLTPWEVQHEFDVVVLDTVVRRRRIVLLELGQFFLELLPYFLRPFLRLGSLAELLEFLFLIHPKLFLDGPELVVEIIFPLLLVDVALDFLVDLLLDLEQLGLGVQGGQKLHGPDFHVVVPEQVHFLREVLQLDGRGYEVHQESKIVDGLQGSHSLFRSEGR